MKKLIYNNIEYDVLDDTRTIFILTIKEATPLYFVCDHKRCKWDGEKYIATGIRTVQVVSCSGENPFEDKEK